MNEKPRTRATPRPAGRRSRSRGPSWRRAEDSGAEEGPPSSASAASSCFRRQKLTRSAAADLCRSATLCRRARERVCVGEAPGKASLACGRPGVRANERTHTTRTYIHVCLHTHIYMYVYTHIYTCIHTSRKHSQARAYPACVCVCGVFNIRIPHNESQWIMPGNDRVKIKYTIRKCFFSWKYGFLPGKSNTRAV